MLKNDGKGVVALFTMEMALSDFHLYSGGQGYLIRDLGRSAKEKGIPLVIISLMNHYGYYDQKKDKNGMRAEYAYRNYDGMLEDTGVKFPISICPYPSWEKGLNWIKVWKVAEKNSDHAVPIYLLDTDIPENDALARRNSYFLYGGEKVGATKETAIAQSLILGKGGVKALRENRLNIPVRKYHFNEAHAAFGAIEVYADFFKKTGDAVLAEKLTKEKVVFTTHTPIAAGNPKYDFGMVCAMAGANSHGHSSWTEEILRRWGGNRFDMAAAALRLSGKANAVSKRHMEVVEKMWGWLGSELPPFYSITNGVNQKNWQWEEFRGQNTLEEWKNAKLKYKNLLNSIAKEEGELPLQADIPWMVWTRRWAAYKRPKLLFRDSRWISEHLKNRKFALIMAGKPHPDDQDRIDDWNELYFLSKNKEEFPNFVMLTEYDLELSKLLKGAADLWLNTPRASNESSGTSGMSANMNKALNISAPDGWMFEANPKNHFLFGHRHEQEKIYTQDAYDAEELKKAVGNALVMLAHEREAHTMAENACEEVLAHFTSDRMVDDYNSLLWN